MKHVLLSLALLLCLTTALSKNDGVLPSDKVATLTFKVKDKYLNFPISQAMDRHRLTFQANGMDDLSVVARLSEEPEYWVFKDVSAYKGKVLTITFDGPKEALDKVYQADTICGASTFYCEPNRPQFHFTSRRGWLNDPNGCIWHDGLYHLYYQHNPFEREWENMTWGHATSTDLLHWTEQKPVLFPDRLGTMYSGSAVLDSGNTSGFGNKKNAPIVYAYTADSSEREVQCVAYSLDGGMTLHKYEGNPVIDSHDKWQTRDTRDPRLFWYKEGGHWVMVLNERNGHSIYTSENLREWTYQSHVTGFWECPDLFPLPVDDNPNDVRWVMLGASNTYMIGSFDGKTFTPESGKHRFSTGCIYAAQTFSNVPDGRRIQIGWADIDHKDMPFRGQMLLPTELTLRSTKDGVRLLSKPIAEVASLLTPLYENGNTLNEKEVNTVLKRFALQDGLHLRATLQLTYATSAGLRLDGQNIIDYDMNRNTINGQFYSPQNPTSMSLTIDVYIDRTSVEVFVDDGLYSYSMGRRLTKTTDGQQTRLEFWGAEIGVSNVHIDAVESVWKK